MQVNSNRPVILGLFFLAVLGVLGYYTLFLTDFSLFADKHETTVSFPDANGLRPGDAVQVAGIRAGRVLDLTYDGRAPLERRVTVRLSLDEPMELREGFDIRIEDATLLGGHSVAIDPGPPGGAAIADLSTLTGRIAGNALSGLNRLVSDNEANVTGMLADLRATVADVRQVVADVRAGQGALGLLVGDDTTRARLESGIADIERAADNIAALTDGMRAGKGLAGKLFSDEALGSKVDGVLDGLRTVSDDLAAVVKSAREGDGLLARVLNDAELGADAAAMVRSAREIAKRIEEGQGTLGALINDRALIDELQAAFEGLSSGEGTLAKLINDPAIYEKLDALLDDLITASAALREGRGTLGALIMERDLLDEVEKAVAVLTNTLEEYREAAPITTFTSILFGAM